MLKQFLNLQTYLRMTTMTTKRKNTLAWVVAGILATIFLLAGITKLMGHEMHVQNFARWGYPAWAMTAIGVLEVICGIGVLIPGMRRFVTGSLVLVMIGAIITHVINGEMGAILVPSLLLILCIAFIALRAEAE